MAPSIKGQLLALAVAEYSSNTGTDWESRLCQGAARDILKALRDDLEKRPEYRRLCIELGFQPQDGGTGGRKRKRRPSQEEDQDSTIPDIVGVDLSTSGQTGTARDSGQRGQASYTETMEEEDAPYTGVTESDQRDTRQAGQAINTHTMEEEHRVYTETIKNLQNQQRRLEHRSRELEEERKTFDDKIREHKAKHQRDREKITQLEDDLEDTKNRLEGRIKALEDRLEEYYHDTCKQAQETCDKYRDKARELQQEQTKHRGEKRGSRATNTAGRTTDRRQEYVYNPKGRQPASTGSAGKTIGRRCARNVDNREGRQADSKGPDGAAGPSCMDEEASVHAPQENTCTRSPRRKHGMVQLTSGRDVYVSESQFQSALDSSKRSGVTSTRQLDVTSTHPRDVTSGPQYDGSKLARKLLRGCFSVEERKCGSLSEQPRAGYRCLNTATVQAIVECCLKYDPTSSEKTLRAAMASALTSLRNKSGKKNTCR